LVYLAMLAGPSVAGIVMTAVVDGGNGLRAYGARLVKWRVDPIWYAVALVTAPLTLALAMLTLAPFSKAFIPAFLGNGAIDPAGPIRADNLRQFLLLGISVGVGAGLFEELGWTGFAIPNLLKRHSVIGTGLLTGVLWGAWHLLAVLWGSASSFGDVPIPVFMLVALFAFLPPYRVLMVRVYERTGSLLVAILMHASLTASMIIIGPAISGSDSVVYDLTFGSMLWAVVALLGRTGTGGRGTRARGVPSNHDSDPASPVPGPLSGIPGDCPTRGTVDGQTVRFSTLDLTRLSSRGAKMGCVGRPTR